MEAGPIFPLISVQSPSGGLAIRMSFVATGRRSSVPSFACQTDVFAVLTAAFIAFIF
jgi:hypothetical protein